MDPIMVNAIRHGRYIQSEIKRLRAILSKFADSEPNTRARLQSYDAEMINICRIPGVAQYIFGEESP